MGEEIKYAYIIFGAVSLAVLVLTIVLKFFDFGTVKRNKRLVSMLGVGISTFLIFIPIYYAQYSAGGFGIFSNACLIIINALHNTFRVFVLDGEFDIVISSVSELGRPLGACFSVLAGVLYVTAPILTFKNIIMLFGNFRNKFWFRFHDGRPFYIFSELNEKSITLAESIFKDESIKRPVIVFSDVFERDEEGDYEIILRAKDIKAILLKEDITRLDVKRKSGRAEFFLIGENESENVEQAIRLTQEYKNECKKRPISIFLYSDKPSAGYIMDSIDKGEYTLDKALTESIRDDPEAFLENTSYRGNEEKADGPVFRVRRLDSVEMLVRRVLTRKEVVDAVFKDNDAKTVSVTILGMGSCGKEFLKQALSLFQVFGYRLEVNVIDASSAGGGNSENIIKALGHEWPEIITDPGKKSFVRNEMGDANYDIRFFDGVDCFSTDFDRLFEPESPDRDRLKRTQLAIVSLGDDDKNIDAAVMLRSVFDRVNVNEITDEGSCRSARPLIYSVVYDDKKAANLSCKENGGGIVNYRGDSVQVEFIGNLGDQYSYDRIKEEKDIEYSAIRYHIDWLRRDGAKNKDDKAALADAIIEKADTYSNYEYYRKSSVARAVHEKFLADARKYIKINSLDERPRHPSNCLCEHCAEASVTEHMRWNVYMRTQGYRYSPKRNDRAKLHNDLISWHDLPELEKYKDKEPAYRA